MSEIKDAEEVKVRLLALLLGGLIWLALTLERPSEMRLLIPMGLDHLPSGLQLTSTPPRNVEVTVVGPRILLLRPFLMGVHGSLDLTGAQPGPMSFNARECSYQLDRELKVVRVAPAVLRLEFSRKNPGASDPGHQ